MAKRKQAGRKNETQIATSKSSFEDGVSKTLGGITIWGRDNRTLEFALIELRDSVEQAARSQLSCTRAVLKKLTEESLERSIDDRIFSAVLGWSLRRGVMDTFVCGSTQDRPFWVVVHKSKRGQFLAGIAAARRLLSRGSQVEVRDVERILFPARSYNTWSSAMHVLAVLSYLGFAEFLEDRKARMVDNMLL